VSLRLTGIGHAYSEGRAVLVDIDLEAGEDQTIAVVGPSGSGKTTLLSIAGGLQRPTTGTIELDGKPLTHRSFPPGTLSWVFQTINLLGRRTALDNVALGLHALGCDREEATRRATEMLWGVGLRGLEHNLALTLSGGQAQRVGVARGLVGRPRYLLADEPTGQLDQSTSRLVAEVLFAARPPGTTVIVATHDPLIAEACGRWYALADGRLRVIR
jgi:ABC-type lipoprotein export system ATPase subunit